MAIEKAKEGLRHRMVSAVHVYMHKLATCLCHPRTGACVEIVYAAHGIHDASAAMTMGVYAMLLIVAVAHLIWVHLE